MTPDILLPVAVLGDLWSVCCAAFHGIVAVLYLIFLLILALPSLIGLLLIGMLVSAVLGAFR